MATSVGTDEVHDFSKKPANARHKHNATRLNELDPEGIARLAAKALDAKFTTMCAGASCILSTRTGSQDMPQVKMELQGQSPMQVLCVHAVAINAGKRPQRWFDQISHLCGIRQCVNADHLIWELPWDNSSRDGCHKFKYWPECIHMPPCLPEPPYEACMNAIAAKRAEVKHAFESDPKKVKKRALNSAAYQKKKKLKAEQSKSTRLK
jgi:hypothetical protein